MLPSHTLLEALATDPLVLYPALAACLLAAVGLASGLLRGDVVALSRPLPVAWVLGAVAAVWALQRATTGLDGVWAAPAAALAAAPLALIAIGYGPTPAVIALALTHAWVGVPSATAGLAPGADAWLSALQLVVLGWLSMGPSPRRWWGVAGAHLALAHALTWATGGLALIGALHGGVSLATLAATHGLRLEGTALLVIALALVPPRAWRALFPGGRHDAVDRVDEGAAVDAVAPRPTTARRRAHGRRRRRAPGVRRRADADRADADAVVAPVKRSARRRTRP